MALPTTPANSWMQSLDFPSQLFEFGKTDYELYEEDGEFVLSLELPGFEVDDIDMSWDDGILNIAAEHEDETRNRRRTYHRRFRFPKEIESEDITAQYINGVLDVHLPIRQDAIVEGTPIEIEG